MFRPVARIGAAPVRRPMDHQQDDSPPDVVFLEGTLCCSESPRLDDQPGLPTCAQLEGC